MEKKVLQIENKMPNGYVEAKYKGYTENGLVIEINSDMTANEYSLAAYNELEGFEIIATNDGVISYSELSSVIKTDILWALCVIYNEDNEQKVKYLRKVDVNIEKIYKEEMYDKRKLCGESYSFSDGREMVPYYEIDGRLAITTVVNKLHLYTPFIKNELVYRYLYNDNENSEKVWINTKCKKIRGNYIGIIPSESIASDDLRNNCIEYCNFDEKSDYISMDFCIPADSLCEKYYTLWNYKGYDYIAPLCEKEEKTTVNMYAAEYIADKGLKISLVYDEETYGKFNKLAVEQYTESWEQPIILDISEQLVDTVQTEDTISVIIKTDDVFSAMNEWMLKVITIKDEVEYAFDIDVSEEVKGLNIYDKEDTKYKLAFKIKDGCCLMVRTYGHNALFKKNVQASDEMDLDTFLQMENISLKGNMYGEYIEDENGINVRLYQYMTDVLEAKLVMFHTQGMGVLSSRDLEVVDGTVKEFKLDVPEIDWDSKFSKPIDSVWFRVAIALRTAEGIYLSMLSNYDADTEIEQQGNLQDSRKLYFKPIGSDSICSVDMSILPYYATNKALSIKLVRPERLYRSQFTNEILSVKIKKDILIVEMRCRKIDGEYKGVIMEYRNVKEDDAETYCIPYESLVEKGDFYIMTTKIDMKQYYMRMLYWDIRCAFEVEGKLYSVSCHSNNEKLLRKYKGVFVDRTYPNDNSIMFPFATASNSVALMHRETCPQDNWRFRLKEKIAEKLYNRFKNHWDKKNIYLIFEKYCTMAQDNGYFFFKYCMDADVEKDFDGEIYFVIDKKAADWEKVVPYKKHVLKYLSLKHMIYLQACKLMISTDTKGHAYVWRSMGSNIKALSYKKKLVFLQHGVTAFKRGHFERGTNVGCESFITTSEFEHDIIRDYLGYPEEEIPVTGFARWDVLHDKSEGHREILMMPTWRTWLDDAENDVFAESDYCKNYMALLNDPRLDEILKRYDVTLNFYLHPKFRKFITEFSVVSENIRLIPFGEEPLNELMMQCNLLITDFSSVAWDVYYMNKPVLFYHFDLDDAYKTLGFYMDMRNDIFGDRAEEPEGLMQLIIEYIENGFQMKEKYAKDREKYFAFVDDNNSERIWKAIQEREW